MRKAFSTQFYILLFGSIGLISCTFLLASQSYDQVCTDRMECSKRIETEKLNNGGGLLWESLSRQFVVSVIPE